MDLSKNAKLIKELRVSQNLTQKDLAEKLGICAKTVSKWENGRGFPDVSYVSKLAEILHVSTDSLLSGDIIKNKEENGNMKKLKFYHCPECGNFLTQTGDGEVFCCGKKLDSLKIQKAENEHLPKIETVEDEYFLTFDHEMTKEHFLSFAVGVRFDSVLVIRLYPEQNAEVRVPKAFGKNIYVLCEKDGLFQAR